MVQFMISSGSSESDAASYRGKVPVKMEVEDFLEEENGPLNKRSKSSFTNQQNSGSDVPPSHYNPLGEPSPLGLRLRKSPSLLDLIQMKLSQGTNSTSESTLNESLNQVVSKDSKGTSAAAATDKLKASNFPASLLRIGQWEYKSRYEGDLVAKCYFAKHKLVWEVLEGGLKSKIEIQWSDIMALKANCPDEGPGTLTVVLARQPLFFRETNPQPRKHTLWQATADFTDGQASTHRQHFLQCPQGLLNKHFEKLIQCDLRLNCLSRQPEIVSDSPFSDPQPCMFEGPEETKVGVSSAPAVQTASFKIEQQDLAGMALQRQSQESPSPSSVMDARAIETSGSHEASSSNGPMNWEQIKVPGLHKSMSVSDLMDHIEHCISEQMNTGDPSLAGGGQEYRGMLEEVAQCLLSDTQLSSASDEKSLMSRVNSLCCLLQKDSASAENLLANADSCLEEPNKEKDIQSQVTPASGNHDSHDDIKTSKADADDASDSKQTASMSRKDSFGDLLLYLPRIASLPKFLFDISEEDSENK